MFHFQGEKKSILICLKVENQYPKWRIFNFSGLVQQISCGRTALSLSYADHHGKVFPWNLSFQWACLSPVVPNQTPQKIMERVSIIVVSFWSCPISRESQALVHQYLMNLWEQKMLMWELQNIKKTLNITVQLNCPNCANAPLHFALEDPEKLDIKSDEYLRLQ